MTGRAGEPAGDLGELFFAKPLKIFLGLVGAVALPRALLLGAMGESPLLYVKLHN